MKVLLAVLENLLANVSGQVEFYTPGGIGLEEKDPFYSWITQDWFNIYSD